MSLYQQTARNGGGEVGIPLHIEEHIYIGTEPEYTIHLSQEELKLLRFDCSMALAFSQFDRYNFLPALLEATDEYP